MNTRIAVPIASAVSFCVKVGDDIWNFLLQGRGGCQPADSAAAAT